MQAGEYVWLTYKEVYDNVIAIGAAIRHVGVQPVSFCTFAFSLITFLNILDPAHFSIWVWDFKE